MTTRRGFFGSLLGAAAIPFVKEVEAKEYEIETNGVSTGGIYSIELEEPIKWYNTARYAMTTCMATASAYVCTQDILTPVKTKKQRVGSN